MDARNIKFECNFVIKCNKKRGSMKIDVSKLFGIALFPLAGFVACGDDSSGSSKPPLSESMPECTADLDSETRMDEESGIEYVCKNGLKKTRLPKRIDRAALPGKTEQVLRKMLRVRPLFLRPLFPKGRTFLHATTI